MQWKHDSNLALNCLLGTLDLLYADTPLKETLYIQLDNTSRENKNRYYIGMMAWMVAVGLVKEIEVSFLMVGHTHEGKHTIVSHHAFG